MVKDNTKRAPGPGTKSLLRMLPMLMKSPLDFLTSIHADYGDLVRFDVGSAAVHSLVDPEHIKHVLTTNSRNYWKGSVFKRTQILFGEGLVISEDDAWQRQRRLMQPSFRSGQVAELISIMADEVRKKLSTFEQASARGDALEMQFEMMTLTLTIVVKSMFSFSITDAELGAIANAFNAVLKYIEVRFLTFFMPDRTPLPRQRAAQEALDYLDSVVFRIIESRRGQAPGDRPNDLMTLLLDARYEGSTEGMNDKQLRDEVITILFGGYEATALALAWYWYVLATHEDVERAVLEERARVFGDGGDVTVEGLRALSYTERVLNETLRLYPPFWVSFRAARNADVIGGYDIPPGAPIIICHYLSHRLPNVWPNPEAFDPARFGEDQVAARSRYDFTPFGAGQRMCIGQHFAMIEMKLISSLILRDYRLRALPEHPTEVAPRATLRSRGGILLGVERVTSR